MNPPSRGSRFDADHPENGVLIPCRFTVINASGCGTTVKDYGFVLREDHLYAEKAARIAALARDVTEVVETLGLSGTSTAVVIRGATSSMLCCWRMKRNRRASG